MSLNLRDRWLLDDVHDFEEPLDWTPRTAIDPQGAHSADDDGGFRQQIHDVDDSELRPALVESVWPAPVHPRARDARARQERPVRGHGNAWRTSKGAAPASRP